MSSVSPDVLWHSHPSTAVQARSRSFVRSVSCLQHSRFYGRIDRRRVGRLDIGFEKHGPYSIMVSTRVSYAQLQSLDLSSILSGGTK